MEYLSEVVDKRFSQSSLPGTKARYSWARGRPAYIGPSNSQELETSKLATTRFSSPSSLQFAFFVSPPPTPTFNTAPSLSSRDISVGTISSDKGSDIPPNTFDSGLTTGSAKEGRDHRDGDWFSDFSVFTGFSFPLT